jgi:RNA recognition motif-containing protein
MNIFVARLDYDTRSEDLREAFEEYGHVSSAKVIFDHYTGNSRGFGFVEMDNEQEAWDAIEDLNDTTLDGRRIVVKRAKPRR